MRSEVKLLGIFCLPSAFRRCCWILCPGVPGSHSGKRIRLSFPTSTRCRPSRSVEALYLHSAAVHVVSVCVFLLLFLSWVLTLPSQVWLWKCTRTACTGLLRTAAGPCFSRLTNDGSTPLTTSPRLPSNCGLFGKCENAPLSIHCICQTLPLESLVWGGGFY